MGIISDLELASAARKAVGKVVATPAQTGQLRAAAILNADACFETCDDEGARAKRMREIARALRVERRLAASGHWSYDLNRHITLRQAYSAAKQAEKKV